jgi:hypothetical protein
MDQRNQPRMKHIERLGQKTDFSCCRLGDQNTCGEDEGRGSLRGGPWGATLLSLEPLVTGEKSLGEEESLTPKTWREREGGLRRK